MGGALGRRWWTASGPLAGGLAAVVAGVGVVALGTGAFGLETHDFTRIDCRSVSVKGGTVWHCTGESPAQARANDEARRRAELAALSGRRDGAVILGRQGQRTRLTFVDHDGRRDPERVTASRLPGTDRWIAHSGDVLGAGVLLSLFGAAGLAWGGLPAASARSWVSLSGTSALLGAISSTRSGFASFNAGEGALGFM